MRSFVHCTCTKDGFALYQVGKNYPVEADFDAHRQVGCLVVLLPDGPIWLGDTAGMTANDIEAAAAAGAMVMEVSPPNKLVLACQMPFPAV